MVEVQVGRRGNDCGWLIARWPHVRVLCAVCCVNTPRPERVQPTCTPPTMYELFWEPNRSPAMPWVKFLVSSAMRWSMLSREGTILLAAYMVRLQKYTLWYCKMRLLCQ